MSVLLGQPHGFEGLGPACESLAPHEPAVSHRNYVPDVPADIHAALLATAPHGHRDEQLIARLDDLVDLDVGLVELFPEPA